MASKSTSSKTLEGDGERRSSRRLGKRQAVKVEQIEASSDDNMSGTKVDLSGVKIEYSSISGDVNSIEMDASNVDIEATENASDDSESAFNQGGMSLDVLAQVATETLAARGSKSKRGQANVKNHDCLNLQQIRMLSDKALLKMFAEPSYDEMRKKYSYKCFLVPNDCQEECKSHGSETKAKKEMMQHLLKHVGELLQKASKNFTAEPLVARKKRLSGAIEVKLSKGSQKRPQRKATVQFYNVLANEQLDQSESEVEISETRWRKQHRSPKARRNSSLASSAEDEEPPPPHRTKIKCRSPAKRFTDRDAKFMDYPGAEGATVRDYDDTRGETLIVELLNRQQPYQDHSYTTVFGRRRNMDVFDDHLEALEGPMEVVGEEEVVEVELLPPDMKSALDQPFVKSAIKAADGNVINICVDAGNLPHVNKIHIPMVRLSKMPIGADSEEGKARSVARYTGVAMESTTLVDNVTSQVPQGGQDVYMASEIPSSSQYPPMPKDDLAMRGRMTVMEEMLTDDEDDDEDITSLIMNPQLSKKDWEKKVALKCIRDLRAKRHRDRDNTAALICRICNDGKVFTATATLMYHYRSHAGIKPFVCLICNTTFTRQHSLNYHMLIHNNQSRFTCKECGRKFRHPSHFKEHMRRHTGETPFHCAECPCSFKTRNTYKRHLKTRHGMLLTSAGVEALPGASNSQPDEIIVQDHQEQDISENWEFYETVVDGEEDDGQQGEIVVIHDNAVVEEVVNTDASSIQARRLPLFTE